MIEIKYLKELPVKSLNNPRAYLRLTGGDIYVDKDNNRYAFLSFKNVLARNFYSLYLMIREFDGDGALIREVKQCYPSIYWQRGTYITDKPIHISNECDGMEVKICFAESNGVAFYEDSLHKENMRKLQKFIPEAYCVLPKLTGHFVIDNDSLAMSADVSSNEPYEEGQSSVAEQSNEPLATEASSNVSSVEVDDNDEEEQFVENNLPEVPAKVKGIRLGFNYASLIALAVTAAILILVFVLISRIF